MTGLQSQVELPKGWAYFTLDDIASKEKNAIKRGPFGSTIKKEYFEPSGYKIYQQQNAIYDDFSTGKYYIGEKKFQELKDFELKPGDLLISCSGTIGRIALVPDNAPRGIINQALLKITLDPRIVFAKYFSDLFKSQSFQKTVLKNTRGTAMKNIASVKDLKQIPLPIPPINEQIRIISKIEELFSFLDAGIESLRKVQVQLKRYRQAVLKYAFEGKLTEEWRRTHKHENNLTIMQKSSVESSFLRLPKEWNWVTVETVGELISGQHILSENYNSMSNGVPYLTGPADFGQTTPVITKWTTKPKVFATLGDVMITVKGAGVGKANILNIEKAAISRQLMAIRSQTIDTNFLFRYIQFNFDKIQKLSQGSTVPGIRREELLNLQIPLCPQDEQKEVVNEIETKLAVILESMKSVDIGLKMSERLRQSILSAAFKGQLVLQNLNDESAERLLKRIKAERASNKNNGQLELSCYVK